MQILGVVNYGVIIFFCKNISYVLIIVHTNLLIWFVKKSSIWINFLVNCFPKPQYTIALLALIKKLLAYLAGYFHEISFWRTMAMVRKLLFNPMHFYSQIRLSMQSILILIITYYQITTVIFEITSQNIVIWE